MFSQSLVLVYALCLVGAGIYFVYTNYFKCPFVKNDIVHFDHNVDTFNGRYQVVTLEKNGTLVLRKLDTPNSFTVRAPWSTYRGRIKRETYATTH